MFLAILCFKSLSLTPPVKLLKLKVCVVCASKCASVCARASAGVEVNCFKKDIVACPRPSNKNVAPHLWVWRFFYMHLSFHLTFFPPELRKAASLLSADFARYSSVESPQRHKSRSKALWKMAWARRMSQWSAYYFSLLKKKKTQGKFAFDEFNKSKAATEEIFS